MLYQNPEYQQPRNSGLDQYRFRLPENDEVQRCAQMLQKAQMINDNRYHHKLYDGLASCLTKLSEFDQAIEIYKQIFQIEEGKKKWDAQRSIKFVSKLKRKKATGMLPDLVPADND